MVKHPPKFEPKSFDSLFATWSLRDLTSNSGGYILVPRDRILSTPEKLVVLFYVSRHSSSAFELEIFPNKACKRLPRFIPGMDEKEYSLLTQRAEELINVLGLSPID